MSLLRCSSFRPFCATASLAVATFSLFVLVMPLAANAQEASSASVQAVTGAAQNSGAQAPVGISNAAAEAAAKAQSFQEPGARQNGNATQNKTFTTKTIAKLKQAEKSLSDIFSRVPCPPPKSSVDPVGTLPHLAAKLAAGQPAVIVAFGSSSTQGFGATSPENTYPSRLVAQLRRQYQTTNVTVVNAGRGGEVASEMMKRLQSSVLDRHPDLVIWQVGTNAVLRDLNLDMVANLVQDGVARVQVAGSDIVLVGPQYSPRITEHPHGASKMVKLLGKVARLRHVGLFPRFKVMREWHDQDDVPIDTFVIADGLHMNDWGYACFAQLLGDDIIRSVGQIKTGVNMRTTVRIYRPM
jgi:lysophospholipase L1-like esterase